MEHRIGYVVGLICGILAGLALVAVLCWLVGKLGGKIGNITLSQKDSFDERQHLARGQAYKVGFFTFMIYMIIVSIMEEIFKISLFMSSGGVWLGICISIFIFAVICIVKDAYMSLYENAKGVILLFLLIGLLNIGFGILSILDGVALLRNGALSYKCINLMVGVLFFAILFVFCGKLFYDKKQEKE